MSKEQRRAALIALSLIASASGGYIAKDDLIAIGQRYCGPTPQAVLELPGGQEIPATPQAITTINASPGVSGVKVKLKLIEATGLLAAWCDPDRQTLEETVDMTLKKGDQ